MDFTTADVTVDDIVEIDKSHQRRQAAFEQMKNLTWGKPHEVLGGLLWQAFADGHLELAGYRCAWVALADAPDAFDGELFLQLVESVAFHDRHSGNPYPSWAVDRDFPGWPDEFNYVIGAKRDDAQFYDTLARRWHEVPDPYGSALGVKLACRDVIDIDELPDGTIDKFAKLHLEQRQPRWGRDFAYSVEKNTTPWDEDEWKEALLDAALSDEVTVIASDQIMRYLRDVATPKELVQVVVKSAAPSQGNLYALRKCVGNGEDLISALEEALEAHDDFQTRRTSDYDEATSAFHLVLAYCLACQETRRIPSPRLDEQFRRFFNGFSPVGYGGKFVEFHEEIRQILSVIPRDRLSRIFVDADKVPWALAAAAPTEEVRRKVARQLADLERPPRNFDIQRRAALNSLGEAMVIPLCDALEDGAKGQKKAMIEALGNYGDDRAVATLVKMLDDKKKSIRDAAASTLLTLPQEAVLDEIDDGLGGSRKRQRLAAAEVLQSLPPSWRAYELAQKFVDEERTADVRAVLETVCEPMEEAPGIDDEVYDEIMDALLDSHGSCWERFVDVGEGLVDIYYDYLTRVVYEGTISTQAPHWEPMNGLMKHFPESPLLIRALINLVGVMRPGSARAALHDATKINPDVPHAVALAVAEDRIRRPDDFGEPPMWTTFFSRENARDWLLENHPDAAMPAALAGLHHDSKPVRDKCVTFIADHPQHLNVDEDLVPVLKARTMAQRRTAVEILAKLSNPAHLPLLAEALENERSKKVEALIEETIVRIESQSLDVTTYPKNAEGDAILNERLGELPAQSIDADIEKNLDELPTLHFKSGASMSDAAFRWFLGEVMAESREHTGDTVRAVRSRVVDKDCHKLCDELIELNGDDEQGWALYMQSIIASPQQIDSLGSRLETFASDASYSWGDDAVEVLVRRGSPQCVRILEDWANRTTKKALRKRAKAALQRMAEAEDVSVAQLVEASMGTFGLDASGARTFDYGARQITVRLRADGTFTYENREGRRFKNMPRARKVDDDELAEKARGTVSKLRKDIKRVRRSQATRLQEAMATQRLWEPDLWSERYADHPVMRSFADGLIWGVYDDDGLVSAFLLDDDTQPVDLDFEVPDFDENRRIGLVHPLELGDSRSEWLEMLADYERVQPFPQLNRLVFEKGHVDDLEAHLASFDPVPAGTFLGRLNKLGYELGPRRGGGRSHYSERPLEEMTIAIRHTGFSPQHLDYADDVEISGVFIESGDEKVRVTDAPPLIYSEVLHDIHMLMDST